MSVSSPFVFLRRYICQSKKQFSRLHLTLFKLQCCDPLIYIYRYAYDIIWHFIVQKQKTIYVCSNNIYRFRVLQNPLRSFRQTMRFEDMVVLFSSDPMRMNFEHSWKTMPSSGFDFTGWTTTTTTTTQQLPSRELTYPPKMACWRWFSFSPGGIC